MIPIPKIPTQFDPDRKFSGIEILLYFVLISFILFVGRILFIPLSFSLLISFILYPVCKWMEGKGLSKTFAIATSLSLMFLFIAGIIFLFILQIREFATEWVPFKTKFLEAINNLRVFIAESYHISLDEQLLFFKNSVNNSGSQVIGFVSDSLIHLSEYLFYIIIIPVFSALILYSRRELANVLYSIFPAGQKDTIKEILVETITVYYNFIKGMLLVYLIVGFLNSLGLLIIGIPNPFMFGFIASILTFIPYIGIIISSLLPITISWITYNSVWYPLAVIMVFSIVQVLEAYVIFPFAVGNRLKINTLVIIIMITLGGVLWGAAGMILFIPFISIVKLIADRTPRLKTLSLLLGNGNQE